jgi:hypothetical protein
MGTKSEPGNFDCYTHAEDDEPLFVLLARDRTAPVIVRAWADARELMLREAWTQQTTIGEMFVELDQINEARQCAGLMEQWRSEHR